MHKLALSLGILAMLSTSTPAPVSAKPVLGAAVGVGEYMNLPGPPVHAGVYVSLGLWASFDLGKFTLTPQLAVEVAPETRQWGFIPTLTADFPVHKRFGLDLILMGMHNQTDSDWSNAEVLLGGGPGLSIYLGRWTVQPNVLALYNFMTSGAALFPGVGLARTLD
jgi:hypothetical protein